MRLGFDVLPSDLEGIRTRLRGAAKFDLSITDVDSRIGTMLEGLMKTIELNNQEWVLREEGKMMVCIIVDAIKPAGLQEAVKEEIAMHRNKTLRTDVFKFVRWLREYATTYQMFVKLRPQDLNPSKGNKPNTGAVCACGGSPKTSPAPSRGAPVSGATPRGGCLKVRLVGPPGPRTSSAPNRGAGGDGSRDQVAKQVNTLKAPAPTTSASRLECVVEGVLPTTATLLDSGSDTFVASLGFVITLLAAGASVVMRDMPRSTDLAPYGKGAPAITVTRKVKLGSVEFQTSYGPLVLRSLDLWVDEDVKDKIELLFGRPVMNALGYSASGVHEAARQQAAV
ncbi:hypothetical protein H310_15021 [Aphanomyces invadans]|uniref:Peptidase A2 domain-containing protein n=1 Tax=Aphanomyces invadans TaxID=157072 RepID=A0A024T7Y1_9STRA|nr:hypothetical protein H310_15021 [Aphanomyces invadans]ETV90145.1 hypothetical protein H310_15021 [Aphanomyces invadans]|eukprot:XP_008881223.1 hypothetical protein H310_15021 [Aphanomyces invadans]